MKTRAFWLIIALWLAAPLAAFAGPSTVSTVTGNLLLTPAHGGDGSAWGKGQCQDCHLITQIHSDAPTVRGIVRAKGYDTCGACHGDNGAGVARPCGTCHNRKDLPGSPYLSGSHKHDFDTRANRKLGDALCLACHVKSDMDGEFERNVDLTPIKDAQGQLSPYASLSDFCLRCHNQDHQPHGVRIKPRRAYGLNDPLTTIEDNYQQIDRHGAVDGGSGPYVGLRAGGYRYGQEVECTDCHVMHGTRNPKLILDDTRKGTTLLEPQFRFEPHRARVRKGKAAQFCVLCHAMEHPEVEDGLKDTGNGLSGVHDVTSDCSDCHVHGEPTKGGL
jgi:hypothetical protein